uniref:Structural maintenance of chromosomes protein n=1 Tax=Parastrongyloides trichosuri TaxID=131310 RepID=A0A0N5A5C2_PARTI
MTETEHASFDDNNDLSPQPFDRRKRKLTSNNNNEKFQGERKKKRQNSPAPEIKYDDNLDIKKYKDLLEKDICDSNYMDIGSEQKVGRLILSKVVFENFKSYLGRKVLGEFDTNFTSIVGNNGSGKSNVIDGFLFVFDYSPKKIRMKKFCELIHHSSQGSPDYASVEIHFKRIDNNTINEEFTIKRFVYKDNNTYYEINGKKREKKFVKIFLKDHGLGLDHDRFLILQGEVESISLLKPKAEKEGEEGFLEYLDDIIGTLKFKKIIEKLEICIIELQRNIVLRRGKVKDAQRYLDDMVDAVANIIKSCRIENAIIDRKYIIYSIERRELQVQIQAAKIEYEKDKDKAIEIQREKDNLANEISKIRNEKMKLEEVFMEARKKLSDVESLLSQHENELSSSNIKLKAYNEETEERRMENIKLTDELEKALIEPNKLYECIQKANKDLQDFERKIEELLLSKTAAEDRFESERKKYTNELDSKEKIYQDQNTEIISLINEKNSKEDSLRVALSSQTEIDKKIIDIENIIEDLKTEDNKNLEQLEEYKKKLNSTTIEKKAIVSKIEEIENKLININTKKDLVKREFAILKDQYDSMNGSEPTNRIYQFLRERHCSGFRGRLGDLATIDSKYDIALSTLGGHQLNYYVVDTSEDGQYLINELKKEKIGRASFCIIEEIPYKDSMDKKKDYSGGVIRAFDLLNITDNAVRKCFYHVYRESLIVNSINDFETTKRAFGGAFTKMCSLDGAITESSGKITGGGRPLQGMICCKDTVSRTYSEIDKRNCKASIDKLEQELDKIRNSFINYNDELTSLKQKLYTCRVEEEKYNEKVSSIKQSVEINFRKIQSLDKRLEDAKGDSKNIEIDMDNVNDIKKEIEEMNKMIENKKESLRKAEIDFKEISKIVDNVRKDIIGTLEQEYNDLLKEKETKENEIKNLKDNFNCLKFRFSKKQKDLQDNEKFLENLLNKISELENHVSASYDKIEELTEVRRKCNEEVVRLNVILTNSTSVIELERRMTEVNEIFEEITRTIEILEEQIRQYKVRIKSIDVFMESAKYTFFVEMAMLSNHLMKFDKDEVYYSERVEKAEYNFMKSVLNGEIIEGYKFLKVSLEPLDDQYIEEVRLREFQKYKDDLNILLSLEKVSLDYEIISDYSKRLENRDLMDKVYNEYVDIYESLKKKNDELISKRYKQFQEGFEIIAKNVKKVYQQITFGGDAELECIDIFDPYSSGISYSVRPPGKSWKKMTNLSGGEKTLSSLAFVFALHIFNPTPLYVMDEIDAALDFRNVGIIADYIRERTKNAQFIVISLRKELYERCNKVLGIWKINDVSRCMVQPSNSHEMEENTNISCKIDLDQLIKRLKSLRGK